MYRKRYKEYKRKRIYYPSRPLSYNEPTYHQKIGRTLQSTPRELVNTPDVMISRSKLDQMYQTLKLYNYPLSDPEPPTPSPSPPPVVVLFNPFYFVNYGDRVTTENQGIHLSLYDVRSRMSGTEPILNLPDDLVQTISHFTIFITINTLEILSNTLNAQTFLMKNRLLGGTEFTYNLDVYESLIYSFSLLNQGATSVYGYFLNRNTNNTVITNYGTGLPCSQNIGPVGERTWVYSGDNAISFYLDFKNNDVPPVLQNIKIFDCNTATPENMGVFHYTFNYSVFMFIDFDSQNT